MDLAYMLTKEYEENARAELERKGIVAKQFAQDCIEGKTLREEFAEADARRNTGFIYSNGRYSLLP